MADRFDELAKTIIRGVLNGVGQPGTPYTGIVENVAQALRDAVEAEREACAKVLDTMAEETSSCTHGAELDFIAATIRARSGEGK
jgi:hypothetical protein